MKVRTKSAYVWRLSASCLGLCLAANSAQAQSTSSTAQPTDASPAASAASDQQASDTSADIIVTAQRRDQRLIDVPLSVTAISGEELTRRGADALVDAQYSVPGLTINQTNPGASRPQIRGVSVQAGSPAIGTYLDELPLDGDLAGSNTDVRIFDLQRVEVLRGPQGTLYGQGAMGGTIRYITHDVDLNRIGAELNGEVAGVNGGGTDARIDGVVNLPIVDDRVGLRVSGIYQRFGGWIDNTFLGQRNVNSGDTYAIRGKLTAKLTDQLKVTVLAQHQDLNLGAANVSDANEQQTLRIPAPKRDRGTFINALVTYDLGGATLLSSTGFVDRYYSTTTDYSGYYIPILSAVLGIPAGSFDTVQDITILRQHIFTQELRLSSNGSGPFSYTVGGFYRNSRNSPYENLFATPAILPFSIATLGGSYPYNSRSYALYGEAAYRFVPTLTATIGLRYFHDHQVEDLNQTSFGTPILATATSNPHALSPRFNLSWRPSDNVNIYANVAKGFRSGGFNATANPNIPPSYRPDTIWSYEVGGKFQSADRKLNIELAGYRTVWDNVQSVVNSGVGTSFTANSGKLLSWGADGSISYRPLPPLTLTLTAGYNNSKYHSTTAEHVPGDPADYVPRFTGSASAEYNFDLGSLPAFVRVDYQHSSHYQIFIRNFQPGPAFSDSQDILNARVGVNKANWSVSVFAKNLLNRDYITYPAFAASPYPARLEPRQIGASLGVRY